MCTTLYWPLYYSTGYGDFASFAKCLGKGVNDASKIWSEVYGKFDSAILRLLTVVLQQTKDTTESIEERLSDALTSMEDDESALYAAKAIEKGS